MLPGVTGGSAIELSATDAWAKPCGDIPILHTCREIVGKSVPEVSPFAQPDGRGSANPLRWTTLPIHHPACTAVR